MSSPMMFASMSVIPVYDVNMGLESDMFLFHCLLAKPTIAIEDSPDHTPHCPGITYPSGDQIRESK